MLVSETHWERARKHAWQGETECVQGRGSQKIGTRLDRNAVEKVENDAWKRAGEGGDSTLSCTLVWKILASLTIKVGGVVRRYGPLLIVASGLESSSAYQLSDRQRAALFSSTDTRRRPSGCQVPPDPAIPRR